MTIGEQIVTQTSAWELGFENCLWIKTTLILMERNDHSACNGTSEEGGIRTSKTLSSWTKDLFSRKTVLTNFKCCRKTIKMRKADDNGEIYKLR